MKEKEDTDGTDGDDESEEDDAKTEVRLRFLKCHL